MSVDDLFSRVDRITTTVGNVAQTVRNGAAPNRQPAPAVSSTFTLPAKTLLIVGGVLLVAVLFFAFRRK